MTVINPPGYLHNVATHTAQVDRIAAIASGMVPDGAGLTWREGVRGFGDLLVAAQATPNMTVQVAAGLAFVKGTSNTFQGLYTVANDASVNVTITAAHATLGRRDLIVARIQDAFYAGAANTATIEVVTGTAASSPVDPALPASSLLLARITVDPAVTSITNAKITDLRKWSAALGGTIMCLSTARPTAVGNRGTSIYETDTGWSYVSDGVNWVDKKARGNVSFTFSSTGSFAPGDSTIVTAPSYTSDGTRKLYITWGATLTPVSAGTGTLLTLRRSVNGGAASDMRALWLVGPSTSTSQTGIQDFVDTPPAGNISYLVRGQGHGVNGGVITQWHINIEDVGSAV